MTTATANGPLFSDIPERPSMLPWRFVLFGLLVHLVLFSLPDKQARPPVSEALIEVQLTQAVTAPAPDTIEIPDPEPVVPAEIPPPVPETSLAEPAEVTPVPPLPAPAPSEAVAAPPESPAIIDRESLLEAVTRMDWKITDPASEQKLGRVHDGTVLEALYKPIIPGFSNTFDGMSAPSEVEIVDRWLEPSGVHQVVIRAPDGNTYCGRQEPVDDMRPWLQMPMLFHSCAGGGKRSGIKNWRNN